MMNSVAFIDSRPLTNIAQIIFSMFVHIADAERSITAQEVRRFQTLFKETGWIENPDIREGANELKENYSTYWANYEDGRLQTGPDSISQIITATIPLLGDERGQKFRTDLSKLLTRLESSIYGIRFMQSQPPAKAIARQDVAKAIDGSIVISTVDFVESKVAKHQPASIEKENAKPVSQSTVSQVQSTVWQSGKTKVRCVDVIAETHDTKTYNFVAEPSVLFHYKPGQFVTIEITLPNQILRRSYTISSSPSRPHILSITVKKVPMGWMSNWLYDNMVEGLECTVNGPSGKFSCADHPSEKMLFLAAGSGITPCMSMLRWLVDTSTKTDIVFINNVRTPNDIIFHQELLYLSTRLGSRLKLAIVPSALYAGHPWHGPMGTLSEELLRSYAPDFLDREVFVCGPPGYMQAAKNMLAALGLPMKRYHDESFGGATPSSAPSPIASSLSAAALPLSQPLTAVTARTNPPQTISAFNVPPSALPTTKPAPAANIPQAVPTKETKAGQAARITIQGGQSFSVEPGQSILDAAESCGINLEHSCRSGICGACKMQKVSGKVLMEDGHVLSDDEVASGHILTCIGKPQGDVIIA